MCFFILAWDQMLFLSMLLGMQPIMGVTRGCTVSRGVLIILMSAVKWWLLL